MMSVFRPTKRFDVGGLRPWLSLIEARGTHIRFMIAPPKARTKVWWVVSSYDDTCLGWVAWFSRWWKYSFYPEQGRVFEEVCLREIAQFCVDQTLIHKEHRKQGFSEGCVVA
jgi:hypothetical protein